MTITSYIINFGIENVVRNYELYIINTKYNLSRNQEKSTEDSTREEVREW